jgi:hypothetical protein
LTNSLVGTVLNLLVLETIRTFAWLERLNRLLLTF